MFLTVSGIRGLGLVFSGLGIGREHSIPFLDPQYGRLGLVVVGVPSMGRLWLFLEVFLQLALGWLRLPSL